MNSLSAYSLALFFSLICTASADSSDPKTIVLQFAEAFNQHDPDAMSAFLAPDAAWHTINGGEISTEAAGSKAIRESMVDYFASLPSVRSTLHNIMRSGDFVTVVERPEWERNNETKSQCSVAVYEVSGGLVKNVWYYPEYACDEVGNAAMSEKKRHDKHIDYVELPSTDIAATKAFYGSVFGWTFVDYGPEYIAIESSGLDGGFRKADDVTPGGALVVMFSTDIEGARDAVAKAGGEIVEDIFDFPGGRRFEFHDPSGNRLAVWAEPAAE